MAKDTGLHGYKDTGRHIISLLISFQAIYCLHTLALCLCVAYLRSGIRNSSRSRSRVPAVGTIKAAFARSLTVTTGVSESGVTAPAPALALGQAVNPGLNPSLSLKRHIDDVAADDDSLLEEDEDELEMLEEEEEQVGGGGVAGSGVPMPGGAGAGSSGGGGGAGSRSRSRSRSGDGAGAGAG